MLNPLTSLRILPLISSKKALCSLEEQCDSILSRLLQVTALFPLSPLLSPCPAVCWESAAGMPMFTGFVGKMKQGKAPGANGGALLLGARGGERVARSRGQAGQRSNLLSGLGPDVSQPTQGERKHPCLV